ncbi:MAG TPA: hypothetical protein VNJ07_02175 [Chitinophagales bacterium]|nr:hypothetical protein [Chitinophagales bacterium]
MPGFIDMEVKRLSVQKPMVQKMVFLNGKKEIKITGISNWENELSAFKEADINKKSFLGKYKVDSTFIGGNLLLRYSATEEKFRIRELTVQYDSEKKPAKITAVMAASNVLYSSHQQLGYEAGKGYWISGKQIIRFLEQDSFAIDALFSP